MSARINKLNSEKSVFDASPIACDEMSAYIMPYHT